MVILIKRRTLNLDHGSHGNVDLSEKDELGDPDQDYQKTRLQENRITGLPEKGK